MKNKKEVITVTIIIGIVVVLLMSGGGISINGLFFFSTAYYQNPIKAFNDEASINDEVDENNEYNLICLDESNGICVTYNDDNEIVIFNVAIKKDKYYALGSYSIFSPENLNRMNDKCTKLDNVFFRTTLYNKGVANGKVKYLPMSGPIDKFEDEIKENNYHVQLCDKLSFLGEYYIIWVEA
ncbi:MAG: hypothetical protein ACI4VI_06170 [Acutalibacteraceae bacterium]